METPVTLSTCSANSSKAGKRQRLVICLDGTWNNRDDNTNVLHHFGLIREGEVRDKDGGTIFQCSEYHRGVGTGVLDRVSGGAFGFGLEQNVRNAYNWLVQNFDESDDRGRPNEIYIFGFSRGAYTARSLVGFIGRCGLLRRGAPLTVNQLWEQYCILGRQHEERRSLFERAFGATPTRIRQISELVCDPWQVGEFEKNRKPNPDAPDPADRVPGQRAHDLNETEKLLVRWSRRVRITFLGVYDTVGAMGLDALAIPVLKSKLALHHNMRPTTLIQNCRHALAVDEHRSSFNHTPFVAYMGHETVNERHVRTGSTEVPQQYEAGEAGTDLTHRQDWQRVRAMWNRKIEQRWFVGAHSNVGGGYPDNRLAERPYQWVLQGAIDAGLVCEDVPAPPPLADPLPIPRDSFWEFARPFWTMLFRAKPFYRPIDPQPEVRATPKAMNNALVQPGFALENINERVDDSVFAYWAKRQRPPNLAEYAKRKIPGEKAESPENNPAHPWLENKTAEYVALVLWASLAAVGIASVRGVVLASHGVSDWMIRALAFAAFAFALVDWSESKANFVLASGRPSPRRRAFLDSIYWTRALGVVLCVAGAVAAFNHLTMLGWNEDDFSTALLRAVQVMGRWWPVMAGAVAGVFLANLCDGRIQQSRLTAACGAVFGGPALAVAAILSVVFTTSFIGAVVAPLLNLGTIKIHAAPELAAFGGLLLLLQFGAMYFLKAFSWCGEPMLKANLGSIVPLQISGTPGRVKKCLDTWCYRLNGRAHSPSPAQPSPQCNMCRLVSESLWRDFIGFIPIYALVLGFGLWFAAVPLEWTWLRTEISLASLDVPLWLLIPIATAAADYLENFLHLRFLHLHTRGRTPPFALTLVASLASLIKVAGFFTAVLLTSGAIAEGSWRGAVYSNQVGWRGPVAFSISVIAVAMLLILLGGYLYQKIRRR